MRKDVKKVKVLIIRKFTQHIAKLKSKKGTKELILKNQRRAQRLLEEIHSVKPNNTAEDRAIARLATHPLLKQKIAAIKVVPQASTQAKEPLHSKVTSVKQQGKKPEPQPLHPSWEASRKREEQRAQITTFQREKIVFDD